MVGIYKYISDRRRNTNLEEYISFFTEINGGVYENDDDYKYEIAALLVVNLSEKVPKNLYNNITIKRIGTSI